MVILQKLYFFIGSFVNPILPVPRGFGHLQGVERSWDGWDGEQHFFSTGSVPTGRASIPDICCLPVLLEKKKMDLFTPA